MNLVVDDNLNTIMTERVAMGAGGGGVNAACGLDSAEKGILKKKKIPYH